MRGEQGQRASVVPCGRNVCRKVRGRDEAFPLNTGPPWEGSWVFKAMLKSVGLILKVKGLKHDRGTIRKKVRGVTEYLNV